MMTKRTAICTVFILFAQYSLGQTAINAGAPTSGSTTLPQRNIQIELRQVQRQDSQREGMQSTARVEVSPSTSISIQGQLQVQQQQTRNNSSSLQYALVLNGYSTRINLGINTPLRLMQTYFRNGTLFTNPSMVIVQTNTGFVATPRWDGSDRVELEISAQQASPAGAFNRGSGGLEARQSNAVTSTLMLPLGEWTTLAQSEQDSTATSSGLGGTVGQSTRTGYDVQVRLSVK